MMAYLKELILSKNIVSLTTYLRRLLGMKACPNEKRIAKKDDLKKMKKEILKQDRKEDNKMYVKKSSKGKK